MNITADVHALLNMAMTIAVPPTVDLSIKLDQ